MYVCAANRHPGYAGCGGSCHADAHAGSTGYGGCRSSGGFGRPVPAYAYAVTTSHSDARTFCHANPDTNGYSHPYTYRHTVAHCNPYAHRNTLAHAYAYAKPGGDSRGS